MQELNKYELAKMLRRHGSLWNEELVVIAKNLGFNIPEYLPFDDYLCSAYDQAVQKGILPKFIREIIATLEDRIRFMETSEHYKNPKGQITKLRKTINLLQSSGWLEQSEGRILSHKELVEIVEKLGELEGLYPSRNYRCDRWRLDVVWKKVEAGEPHYVFEIQRGGNLSEAFERLKHAFDKWGSKLILILGEKDMGKALQSVTGSHHEIKKHLVLLYPEQIIQLWELKKKIVPLEAKIL